MLVDSREDDLICAACGGEGVSGSHSETDANGFEIEVLDVCQECKGAGTVTASHIYNL